MIRKEELSLVKEWDKTFPISEKVDHTKVTFVNRYGITLAAGKYAGNKELMIIPGAVHTDLYDGGGKDAIPFDKLEAFYTEYLK